MEKVCSMAQNNHHNYALRKHNLNIRWNNTIDEIDLFGLSLTEHRVDSVCDTWQQDTTPVNIMFFTDWVNVYILAPAGW